MLPAVCDSPVALWGNGGQGGPFKPSFGLSGVKVSLLVGVSNMGAAMVAAEGDKMGLS
jgi:hypothetical protein